MTTRRGHGDAAPYWSEPHKMWRAQIDVGYKNGKRQRKTVYASTKQRCQQKLNAARRAKDAGDLTTSSMRLDAWLRYWLDEVINTEVKPRTLADYRSKVESYLIPTLGKHRLDRLTPIHVRGMHRDLMAPDRKPKPLAPATVTHAHWVLAGALDDAMTNAGLTRNVTDSVHPPRSSDTEGRSLTADEVWRVLEASGADRARWMFALFTGARQGECLGLRWSHVDLDKCEADLAWSLQRVPYVHGCGRDKDKWTCKRRADRCPTRRLEVPAGMPHEVLEGNLCLLRPKTTGSVRVVPLVPGLVHALRELQATDTGPNPHGLVFHRPDGRPTDGRTDYRAWQSTLETAGVGPLPIPLHAARHTATSIMMNAGVPESLRMQVLGHSQVSTARLYAHADQSLTRSAVATIETAVTEAGQRLGG